MACSGRTETERLIESTFTKRRGATPNGPSHESIGVRAHFFPGVIGKSKFIYDLWGDTVNLASRMESHGVAGQIHVSEAVYKRIKGRFRVEPRGDIEIKGKGPMPTYLVDDNDPITNHHPQ
jgi:hypothetical protein